MTSKRENRWLEPMLVAATLIPATIVFVATESLLERSAWFAVPLAIVYLSFGLALRKYARHTRGKRDSE